MRHKNAMSCPLWQQAQTVWIVCGSQYAQTGLVEGLQLPPLDPRKELLWRTHALSIHHRHPRCQVTSLGQVTFQAYLEEKKTDTGSNSCKSWKAVKSPNKIDGKDVLHAQSGDFHRLGAIADEVQGTWWFRCVSTSHNPAQKSAWEYVSGTNPICQYILTWHRHIESSPSHASMYWIHVRLQHMTFSRVSMCMGVCVCMHECMHASVCACMSLGTIVCLSSARVLLHMGLVYNCDLDARVCMYPDVLFV